MANVKISIINASTVLTDEQVGAVVPALQTQIHRDFAPAWGIDADLEFVPKAASGSWWLSVLDNSDQAGALGYHDVTTEGLPLAKVFAGSDIQFGTSWTVTISHELLEMLVDPEIHLTVFEQGDAGAGRLFAYECADACEDDRWGYQIDGVMVSDFVYPSWFELSRVPAKFDQQSLIVKPLELLPGGYIGFFDVGTGSGWQQLTAEMHPYPYKHGVRAPAGSRRERRRTPRSQWRHSTV